MVCLLVVGDVRLVMHWIESVIVVQILDTDRLESLHQNGKGH